MDPWDPWGRGPSGTAKKFETGFCCVERFRPVYGLIIRKLLHCTFMALGAQQKAWQVQTVDAGDDAPVGQEGVY